MTLKEQVIERWKKGQSVTRIQREMAITLDLYDIPLAELNKAILRGRFETLRWRKTL